MTAQLLPNVRQQWLDSNGLPLVGGKLYSYQAGTTTPLATYTDQTAITPNANPVVLDSTGSASVWLSSSAYKFILKDSSGNTLWTVDNVSIINPASIDKTKIASNVAGLGLSQNGTGAIDVQVDNVTLQIVGNQLVVKTITADSFQASSKLEVVTRYVRDISVTGAIQQIPQYEWTSPTLIGNPITLPPATAKRSRWSPTGEFLAVGSSSTPFIDIYQMTAGVLTKLANPGTLPAGAVYDLSWSPSGDFLAVAHASSPYITIYLRTGNAFSKLSDPSSIPVNSGGPGIINEKIAFSPNSDFLCITSTSGSTPLIMYERAGTTFTDITSTSTISGVTSQVAWSPDSSIFIGVDSVSGGLDAYLRADNVFSSITAPVVTSYLTHIKDIAFSPDGKFLAVAVDITPYILIFTVTSGVFAQLSNPASLPTAALTCIEWSANSQYLACGQSTTPFITIYQVSGTTFTKQTNPGTLPTDAISGLGWSPSKQYLAMAIASTPFVQVYKSASTYPSNALLWSRGTPNVF